MKVKIRSFAMIREVIGSKLVELTVEEDLTLQELIKVFISKFPKADDYLLFNGTFSKNYVVALNGNRIDVNNFDNISIQENDEVAIIPPAGGG